MADLDCSIMTKARGRTRQSHGLVDMQETAPAEDFLSQFPPEELEEDEYDFDLGPEDRCIHKFLYHHHSIVWFSIVQQTLDDGQWHTVIRADTCHDEAHVHRFRRRRGEESQRRVLCQVSSIEEVGRGFDEASDLITEQWEENVRRWRSS